MPKIEKEDDTEEISNSRQVEEEMNTVGLAGLPSSFSSGL